MREMDAFEQSYKNGFAAGMKAAEEKIVRCKDCQHLKKYRNVNWCDEFDDGYYHPADDDFCSIGEKRSGNGRRRMTMRLIDADRAKKDFNLNFGGVSHAVIANRILDEQPTIDAVEVVRCKDCKHLERYQNANWCEVFDDGYYNPADDDFCSNGERRENGR